MASDQIIADFKAKMKSFKETLEGFNKTVYDPFFDKNEDQILPLNLYKEDVDFDADILDEIKKMDLDIQTMEDKLRNNSNYLKQQTDEELRIWSEELENWTVKINKLNTEVNEVIAAYKKNDNLNTGETPLNDKVKALAKNAVARALSGGIDIKHRADATTKGTAAPVKMVSTAPRVPATVSTKDAKETIEKMKKDLTSIKEYWVSINAEDNRTYQACNILIDKI
ncbi:MAG: hypothetical protein Q7I98_02615, partial [Erysipelotrichaceae bacterium]|nr:hypothetical protein [Erysipelotrichaceae bacterium]